ncbi:hypothetical protein HNR21_001339 [Actinomadura cellulosilytica]|uniref:Uncharacterized protein n=1 Tax=Thermomonospora cellulosilytica TaxID=1411118 RepID=A0A7W3MV17_9ACTN|nr:hypothetical protein [Thermomonospora cellulosilytica]
MGYWMFLSRHEADEADEVAAPLDRPGGSRAAPAHGRAGP